MKQKTSPAPAWTSGYPRLSLVYRRNTHARVVGSNPGHVKTFCAQGETSDAYFKMNYMLFKLSFDRKVVFLFKFEISIRVENAEQNCIKLVPTL